jgi:hypothetical protein
MRGRLIIAVVVLAAIGAAAFAFFDDAMWWRCRQAPTRACIADRAWGEATKVFGPRERLTGLAQVVYAQRFADDGVVAARRAVAMPAEREPYVLERDALQLAAVQVLGQAGHYGEAEAALKTISWDHLREWGIEALASLMAAHGRPVGDIVAMVERTAKPESGASLMAALAIAETAAARGEDPALLRLIAAAPPRKPVDDIVPPGNDGKHLALRVQPMAIVAMAQLRARRIDDALASARRVSDWRARAEVTAGLGTLAASAGWRDDLGRVLDAIAAMAVAERRAALRMVLRPRIAWLFHNDDSRNAFVSLRPQTPDASSFFSHRQVPPPKPGPLDALMARVAAVFAAEEERVLAYAAIAAASAAAGETDEALAVTEKIGAPWPAVVALQAIAVAQRGDGRSTLRRAHALARTDGDAQELLSEILALQSAPAFIDDAVSTAQDLAMTPYEFERAPLVRDLARGMGSTASPERDFWAVMRATRFEDEGAFMRARLHFARALAGRGRMAEAFAQIDAYRKAFPRARYKADDPELIYGEGVDPVDAALRDIVRERAGGARAFADADAAARRIGLPSMRADAFIAIAAAYGEEPAQAGAALRQAVMLIDEIDDMERRFEVFAAAIAVSK